MGLNNYIIGVISNFKFNGKLVDSELSNLGNINDTYILKFKERDNKENRYILQKVNCNIFDKPKELMDNIMKVTEHIKRKVREKNGDEDRETLSIVKTYNNRNYYTSENGECWRAFNFIEDATTYMIVENPKHMYQVGKILGRFQNYLIDFNASSLYETIPHFHNTEKRFKDLIKAINDDKFDRVKTALPEIDFILTREKETSIIVDLIKSGEIPIRVTHNDTKINNIMIDNHTEEGIALIDLDTVMPGSYLYDFGDAVRSGASTALEDEEDLQKVTIDLDLYTNFKEGYLECVEHILTKKEKELLPFSVKLITLELAIRFLTDYLNGDSYFKVTKKNHNLIRVKNQIKLCYEIENKIIV